MFIYAVLLMLAAGLVLGFILGVASDKLVIVQDPLITLITDLLPGYNCGACGYPGCANFAKGLVEGEAKRISGCRPSKPEEREKIKAAFDANPDMHGNIVDVKI